MTNNQIARGFDGSGTQGLGNERMSATTAQTVPRTRILVT